MDSLNKDSGIITSTKTQVLTGNWTPTVSTPFTGEAKRSSKTGMSIPGYHKLKSSGALLPHTPFNQVEWEARHISGSLSTNDYPGGGTSYSNVSNFKGYDAPIAYRIDDFVDKECNPTGSPSQEIPDYFVQQAMARIYASGFDALTASAEARKTVNGFRGLSRRMVDLATKYSTKRLLQLWLEGRYQFRTLAYDVRDFHSAVTEFDSTREIWSERAGLSYSDTSSDVVATGSSSALNWQIEAAITHNYSLRGAVSGLIQPARFQANVVTTAWELLPYSFVVDWVYGVGVALDALAFQSCASSWTASKGFQCDSEVAYTLTSTSPRPGKAGSASCSWLYLGTRQSRSPITRFSTLPQLTNRPPSWDLSLDLQALAQVRSKLR